MRLRVERGRQYHRRGRTVGEAPHGGGVGRRNLGPLGTEKNTREESMSGLLNWRRLTRSIACGAAAVAMSAAAAFAQSGEPIKIGFSMSLTGPLAANGQMSLVAMKIWEEDVNAGGGLMGRPVKLVYYDDQSSPAQVPGIYTKLLDVDKVDFAVSAYASTQIAPAMPIMIQKKRLFISLFGTGINDEFNYDKYF